jgi:hypothetical protein
MSTCAVVSIWLVCATGTVTADQMTTRTRRVRVAIQTTNCAHPAHSRVRMADVSTLPCCVTDVMSVTTVATKLDVVRARVIEYTDVWCSEKTNLNKTCDQNVVNGRRGGCEHECIDVPNIIPGRVAIHTCKCRTGYEPARVDRHLCVYIRVRTRTFSWLLGVPTSTSVRRTPITAHRTV